MTDLARIEAKLDLIIRSLGLDGRRTQQENDRTVKKVVEMWKEKGQLTKRKARV